MKRNKKTQKKSHSDKGNEYSYKIGKLLSRYVKKSFKSKYLSENNFAENLDNKYPDQFMQLCDSRIESSCKHKPEKSSFDLKMKDLPKAQKNLYKRANASPFRSVKLWYLIDGVLKNLSKNNILTDSQLYDIYIQVLYIVYLMNKNGYFNNDFTQYNIVYTKTVSQNINILGYDIPTHGYLIKPINFGLVLHNKYEMPKGYREKYVNDNDLYSKKKNKYDNINISNHKWKSTDHWFKPVKNTTSEKNKLKKYLPTKPDGTALNKDNTYFFTDKLFKLIHYKTFQGRIFNDDTIKGVLPHYTTPIEAILYLIKNIYYPENHFIIQYKK
jgi:hypothetical protein